MKLLEHVRKLVDGKNAQVTNADITIVAEKPKLAKFIPDMQRSIAAALGLDTDDVNVKATTEEGLGIAGELSLIHIFVKLFEQPKFNMAEQEPVRPVQRVRKVETKEEVKPAPTGTKSSNAKKKKQNNKIAVIATIIVCAVIVIGFAIAITVLAITDKGNTSSTDPNYYSAPESTTTSSAPETTTSNTTVSSDTAPDIVYGCPLSLIHI